MSTKSTFPPRCSAQFAEATKVFGDVHRVSFFLNPNAMQEICKALVALSTTDANLEPTFLQ